MSSHRHGAGGNGHRTFTGEGEDTLRLDGANQHLDLSTIESSRTGSIEAIDAAGSGPHELTLGVSSVRDLSAVTVTDTLQVHAGSDDEVHFVAAWMFAEPLFVDGWFYLNRENRDSESRQSGSRCGCPHAPDIVAAQDERGRPL